MVTGKFTIILVELCILIFYQIYRKSKLHIKSNCNELNTDLDEKKKSIFNKCKKHLKYILPGVLTLMLVLMANYSKAKYVEVKSIDAEITFIKMYYENVETGEKFLTLAEAVNKAATDEPTAKNTIKVINSRTEENTVIIPEGKEIELDTNGKTIIWDKPAIENNGILTISGQGKIIGNDNYLKSGIVNKENGKLIVSDVTIETEGVSIRNYSSVNTESSPSVKIISGTIKSNGRNAVINDSTATGLIVIDGGNISSDQTEGMPTMLNYQGKIIINGGEITSKATRAVNQHENENGVIEINGGTIIGYSGIEVTAGKVIVKGGNIVGTNSCGISARGKGVLIVEPSNSTTKSIISGKTIGVNVIGEATFNFNGGVVKGESGAGSAIVGEANIKEGYAIKKTIDEIVEGTENKVVETAVLELVPIINTESMYVTDGLVTRLDAVNNNGGYHNSSTTTWQDLSSNGKDGTITDGTWGANYLDFNGTSSWVNLGEINNDYQTIEATFSPDVVSTNLQSVIGNWQQGGGGIAIDENGYIYAEHYINSSYAKITSGIKAVAGNKYHVAVTYDGTIEILYINGVEQGRMSVSGTIQVPNESTIMAIGVNPRGNSTEVNRPSYFDGKIYTAAIYNKALTAEQVKRNADAGKALAGGATNAENITYTIRFNEAVTGFTTDNITINNGTKGDFTEVNTGRAYNVEVTTSVNQNNTQTIAIAANRCTDSVGNGIANTDKLVVIDRVAPIVTLSANGGKYNITPGNTTTSVNTTLTASDTGSGIAGSSYAWSTSNSTQPSTWAEFISGTAVSNELSGGNNYLWTNVIDNAGNRATSIKTSSAFIVRYQVVFNANGGTGAPSAQTKVHGTALKLIATEPTKEGYTFKEWNTKADGTGTSYLPGASYTQNSSVTLYAIYAISAENNYEEVNSSGTHINYYETLIDALKNVTNGNTIKVLNNTKEDEMATLDSGKAITLDTNGYTIVSSANIAITNNGELTITGKGKISGVQGIENKEKLIVSNVTIATEEVSIRNYSSINTESSPAVRIISGNIKSNTSNTIVNTTSATGLIVIDGGNISSEQIGGRPTIINYQGKIIINGGEILSSNNRAVCQYQDSKGIIEIRSGTIIGSIGIDVNAGAIKVTGGNISATDTYGARVSGTGTLTFGINEEVPNVSIVTPSVTGETGGVLVSGEGIFNFYDGVIKGQSGSGSAINGIVKDVPTGYVVTKTIDETIETAALGPSAPIITAKLNNSSGNTYTSGNWTNKNVYISVNSENVGAGIKEYQWYENGAWTTRALTTSNNVGTITYTAARNETIRFRAIDNNGAISQEATLSVKIDKTLPTIIVTPANATVCKSKSITITIKDEGGSSLSSSNSYQYYLSSSSTALSGGSWKDYTSGTAFTIGSGITGTRYLFVKRVSDNAGNTSTTNGTATTISNVTYQRFGSYVFDNTKPTAIINTESMYVTDGLVTRLDGVNNNGGSHSASVTTWKDLSSNGKNGTITNGTWGTNYLDFNGTSSWVNLGEINNDYQTVEVTFSPDVVPTSQQCIIGNWEAGGGGIYIDSNGRICGQYYIDGSYKLITSKVRVVTNQKYHAACTYNGTTMVLYVNGVEQGRISVSGTILVPNNSTVMALGANPNGANATTAYFDGKIYNAAVYNKSLTAAQAKTNADAGKALAGGPTNASNITYTIRFNEAVTGFTTDDVTITNGMKGAFTEVTAGRVYKVAGTTSANQNNTQTIALAANGCTDSAGNGIAATNKTIVIDRVAPTVTLSANGGTYNIIPGNTTISVNTTPTASDTGSGIAGLSYAWGASNSQEPSTWTEFTSGTAITKALSGGNNYLWTNVIDNAGNRATSIKTSSAFIVRYQVVFNANGGTGAPSTQNKVHGTALTLSSTKPTRTGYTFKEWNTKADGTGTKYAPGASYTANSAVTLYAQWTANNYTITLNPNGGSYNGKTSNSTITQIYNTPVNLGYPTRTGYTFVGWKTSDGSLVDKNLLTNTTAPGFSSPATNDAGGWRIASASAADGGARTIINVTDAPIPGITKGFSIVGNGKATDIAQDSVPVTAGQQYTISVWAKGTGKLILQSGKGTYKAKSFDMNNVSSWTKYSWTFTAGTDGSVENGLTNIYFGNRGTSGTIQICGMKLENGNGFISDYWNKNATSITLVAEWADKTAPVIVSATASTTSDIQSYVDFNATDAGSGIKYYNISTSTTAPTTWIPVVNAVEATTETKYENNAAWARVFHHNNHWGNVLFSSANSGAEAKSSNTIDKYSVLGNIANYKNSSNWEFMLQYPDVSGAGYNRWTQKSNPVTSNNTIDEYAAVGTPTWTGNAWGGLALSSTTSSTLIDGSPEDSTWYYAIGAYSAYKGGIPGPNSTMIGTVNLWSRIDNLTATTSTNLTRRLGGLKSNTTYYVWVKDSAGNTASKAVTVSNVDATKPTATITSTNNVAASQTATLTIKDTIGLDKYYWGTTNPASSNVTYTTISGTSQTITKTIDAAGTYYLAVLDRAGNRTITSKVFYKTTLTPNRSSVSPTSVITMAGNSFTIPKPSAVTGYTFNGWYKESALTNSAGTSYTPTSSTTLYGKWTANELTFNAQSKSSYYNTAAKIVSITGASNGTGTYTYSISSQKNSGGTAVSYFTISGTTITVKASTPVGKYTVVVKATDSGSSKTKEATMTITVQYPKLTLNGNSGTVTQAAVYPKYGTTSKYTTATGSTAGTIGATRTGYTLNGWYTAASGGTKVLNADGTGTGTAVANYTNASKQFVMTANQTLYAQWKKNNYEGRNRSGTTIEYYTTLNEAFSTTNATVYEIKPLNNVTETQDAIVPSGKSFRVNGDYQINMNEHAIINNGILEIVRVPIVAAKADVAVKNTGTLTCSNEINTNGTAILCTGSGNVRVNGGTIVSSGIGIDFQSSDNLSIAGDSNINTSGDAIKMMKGSLEYISGTTTSKLAGISLNDSIDVIIRGGKISGDNGIWIASTISPTINIIGGEIEGITMHGIASYGTAIVTIGETKSTSATTPSIKGADIGVAMYGGKATMNAGVLSAKNNTLYGSVSPKEGYRFVHSSGVGGYNKTIVQAVAKTTSTTNTTSEEIPIQNITDDTSTAALNNVVEIEPESAQKIENIDNSINTEADKIIKKIAKINETTYPTISEAIASANSGEKIELLEDITLNEEVIVEEDKNIIINLNGKTLTSSSSSTINNKGILKIVGTGNIRNEIDNGVVVNNNGSLKIENGTITTTEKGGKCINNNGKLEINSTSIVKIIVSSDDSIGIYNSKESIACDIKSAEVIIKAEDYDKAKIEQIKPSYGIYNDGNISVNIEGLTMKVERLKGIGIQNNAEGVITIGKNDGVINEFNPIIYATSDNTTAIVNVNTQKGRIKFYDGSFITTNSIKNEITDVLEGYEVFEVENDGKIKSSLRHTEE